MKSIKPYKVKIIFGLLIIIFGIFSAMAFRKMQTIANSPKDKDFEASDGRLFINNESLPADISFIDYKNKSNYNSEIIQSKVLLIYILADCRGCQKEADLIAQSSLSKNQDIKIYAIGNEENQSFDEFSHKHSFNFPIFTDENNEFAKKLKITYFPANFIINNGVIEKSWFGCPRDLADFYDRIGASSAE